MAFRIRSELVSDIKGNFKDKFRRKGGEKALECDDCAEEECQTQTHGLRYPEDLRQGLSLDNIDGVVTLFRRMLAENDKGKNG